MPVDVDAVGNVEPFAAVSVRAQVNGVITEVLFKEGDTVKAGDHLFTIDPAPYRAMLEQAEATLSRDEALLKQAESEKTRDEAQAEYQQVSSQRNSDLVERGIISKDAAQQTHAAATAIAATVAADAAAIESARAQLSAQRAAVDNARLQLAYTIVRAPISGRTGNSVKGGNIANANTTELVSIAQIEPVYVTFSVPSAHLPTIKSQMASGRLTVAATPQDEDPSAVTGALAFVDNLVDPSTDSIKLKAQFENHDRRLWPGEYARVTLHLDTLAGATVVSNEAVQTGQDGEFVFLVTPKSTVEQRPVTVARRVNEEIVISKGLVPGDTVVTEGQLRLEPGTRIHVQTPGGEGRGAGAAAGRGARQ